MTTYYYDNKKWQYIVGDEQLLTPNVHCDTRILHPPSKCVFCDKYGKEAQEQRIRLGVNFTDENQDPNKVPCPAIEARGYVSLNSWGGNIRHDDNMPASEKKKLLSLQSASSMAMYSLEWLKTKCRKKD